MDTTLRALILESEMHADTASRVRFASEMIARAKQVSEKSLKYEASARKEREKKIESAITSAIASFNMSTSYPGSHDFEGDEGVSLPISPIGVCKRIFSKLGFKSYGYEESGFNNAGIECTVILPNSSVWIPVFYLTRGDVFDYEPTPDSCHVMYLMGLGNAIKGLRPLHKDDIKRVEFREWYLGTKILIKARISVKKDGDTVYMAPEEMADAPYECKIMSEQRDILIKPTGQVRESI